jgi:transcriptional regulator with XRE-family HTH domain
MQEKNKKKFAAFGKRLRFIRESLGLNQTEFAKKLGYDSYKAIGRFERGERLPNIEAIIHLVNLGNYDLHWLLTGKTSLAVERLRIYASAHIADVYEKIDSLKMRLAAFEVRQAGGEDCTENIKKITTEIETLRKYGEDLRKHLNEVLGPIGRAFE